MIGVESQSPEIILLGIKTCAGLYNDGNIILDPSNIQDPASGSSNGKLLCKTLRDTYPSGSNRIIPLATTGAVKF